MPTQQDIVLILMRGFRHYVKDAILKKYDDEFAKRKRYTSKFILKVFPKYIDYDYWISRPKEKRDTYLFNYYFVEVPTTGLIYTPLLKRYVNNTHPRLPKVKS